MDPTRRSLRELAIAVNQIDAAYCCFNPPQMGAKASELWLLYALDDGESHSQKQICEEWGMPRTTLNTTIKQMEAAGHLTLSHIPGKRREKQVSLTESGQRFARRVLRPIYEAEEQALSQTARRFSPDFIQALAYFSDCLRASIQKQTETLEQYGET